MRITSFCCAIALCCFAANAHAAGHQPDGKATELQTDTKKQVEALRAQLAKLRQRQKAVRAGAAKLTKLSQEPKPRGLPAADERTWPKFTAFLRASSGRITQTTGAWSTKLDGFDKQLAKVEASGDAGALAAATKQMQEMNQSFNLQYLNLQQAMQADNRKFTMMSNIMKTMHDTAKAVINNIR